MVQGDKVIKINPNVGGGSNTGSKTVPSTGSNNSASIPGKGAGDKRV